VSEETADQLLRNLSKRRRASRFPLGSDTRQKPPLSHCLATQLAQICGISIGLHIDLPGLGLRLADELFVHEPMVPF